MVTNIKEIPTKKEEIVNNPNIMLIGGGDIYPLFNDLGNRQVFAGQKVAYIIIATETVPDLHQSVLKAEKELHQMVIKHGAKKFVYIDTQRLETIYDFDVVILSGGDPKHLTQQLTVCRFPQKILNSSVHTLIGISAGAIALASSGLSNGNGDREFLPGLSLVPFSVVPHSDAEAEKNYPHATHLKDGQIIELS